MTGYRIIELTAENMKRLTVVYIKPDGDVVDISGDNGEGKTSVLDSIDWVLSGATGIDSVPIRKGAKDGRIEVSLGRDGKVDFIVQRKFTEKNPKGYLSITTPDGMEPREPQAMLDKMMGKLSMDPHAYSGMEKVKQWAVLRDLLGIGADIDKLDAQRVAIVKARTETNSAAKFAQTAADSIKLPGDLPEQPPDVQALVRELTSVDEHNAHVRAMIAQNRAAEESEILAAQHVKRCEAALEDARRGLEERRAELEALRQQIIPDLRNSGDISNRLQLAQAIADACKIRDGKRRHEQVAKERAAESEAQTASIQTIDELKGKLMAGAKMPIEGLSFGDGEVLYKGLPFDQASDAERLLVSLAMASALNPKLRVIRIRDGNGLDKKSMAVLTAFAIEHDLQIWIERVTGGEGGIIMVDGHVQGQEALVEEHKAREEVKANDDAPPFAEGDDQKAADYAESIKSAVSGSADPAALVLYRRSAKKRLGPNFENFYRAVNTAIMEREKALPARK